MTMCYASCFSKFFFQVFLAALLQPPTRLQFDVHSKMNALESSSLSSFNEFVI